MDFFSHGFWSYIFFHRTNKPIYAVLFGLLPDSLSWLIYFIYRMLMREEFGKPNLNQIPEWVNSLYNISHSLIVALFVIVLIYLIYKKIPLYIYAWPISIITDVFTHTREFLPTPFLWPISNWKFPGISWGNIEFLIVDYSLIIIFLTIIFIIKINPKKTKKGKKK